MTNWERLEQLLSQDQFELVNFEQISSREKEIDGKVIYLMNDSVESFLVFRNVRYTGTYIEAFEGELDYSLDEENNVLRLNQGESHLLLFFDQLELEYHFYDYGELGHFWVKEHEDLRNLEYQIAIVRDKYDYLGAWACNEMERKIASLKEFPPLNYLSYPAASLKYVVPMDNPWNVSKEAIVFMEFICRKVQDFSLAGLLLRYQKNPSKHMARRIAKKLAENKHSEVTEYLYEFIKEAAGSYPKRTFEQEIEQNREIKWNQAISLQKRLEEQGISTRIYREEPFVFDCDEITWKVYVMLLTKGFRKRKIEIIEV